MPNRTLAVLVVALAFTGSLPAEETRGAITKIEDSSITIRSLVVGNDGIGKIEQKTFKIDKDLKIVRVKVRGKEEMKLTLAELKMAVKAAKVSVRITHQGANCSVIKVIPAGLGG